MTGTVLEGFHNDALMAELSEESLKGKDFLESIEEKTKVTYTFYNHFHPYVGELLEELNRESINGLLNVDFHESNREDFFQALYQPVNTVEGEFYTTDGQGNLSFLKKHTGWRKTWHSIIAVAHRFLLFYDAQKGEGEFYTTDGQGNLSLLKKHTGWRKTWHSVINGNFGIGPSYMELLFYDAQKGEGEFYTTDGQGNFSLLKKHTGWRKTWHSIIAGNFIVGLQRTDLLFYDAQKGEGEFYTTDGQGNLSLLKKHTGWRKTWHSIIAGNFSGSGYTDLLFYDAQKGEGEFYTTDGQGNLSLLKKHTGWRKTWHSIIAGYFDPYSRRGLLFYDAQKGEGEFYTTDGQGNLSLLKKHTGWRKTWHSITEGIFSETANAVLLFYDKLLPLVVRSFPKLIDVSKHGAYAVYNWELLFHVPLSIAVHLSKNQRFAEAQRWFHYIFNPTTNDGQFWRFIAFRKEKDVKQIDDLIRLVSKSDGELDDTERAQRDGIVDGYDRLRRNPFQPHAVARTRFLAYQYCVVMKYLDNLIAWGDSLFRQDTIETINEATQLYVLAANLLGQKPQRIPQRGTVKPKTFHQLRNKLDDLGNALVELEGQFPFNLFFPTTEGVDTAKASSLFGIGPTLYFCIPRNEKLLGYWDTVADRLFKIRHCMNIEGVVRQLPLFQPPIDPGMLVKAAAAGIDISSLVSGLNQPLAPVRSVLLIQKAIELCNEVRSLGGALLSALEKKDAEALGLLRQKHEINIQQMVQDARYLQWKEAEAATESLLQSRESAAERYRFYQRLLGGKEEDLKEITEFTLERRELTEDNFDEVYQALVEQYAKEIERKDYPRLEVLDEGRLYLNRNEDADLNEHAPSSRDFRSAARWAGVLGTALAPIPPLIANISFWGIGIDVVAFRGGEFFATVGSMASEYLSAESAIHDSEGASASKSASFERRADDWMFQSNLAALDLMQIGRQIISSVIREQITRHEYENLKKQIDQAKEVDQFLHDKFTNETLYGWMQGELSKLYYEYYKFAFDIARKAEQTMKHELMRPELDELNFIKFNYWDGGRKGLLSGEALHLDLKRMEMAYHDHNKREYELTKHVSLRQLDPVALLSLKATGVCEVTLPEWLFDLDTPGHYMRRIKNLSVSIPAVTGPYTSINCTLSLQRSTLRRSSILRDGEYRRATGEEDTRFVDYYGTIQSIVTSNAQNDSGMFETNLRDERFLPFEGHGVVSTWRLELPADFRQFDYNTISDVILHLRYTARQGGALLGQKAVAYIEEIVEAANTSGLVQMFSLKYDFPNEWHRFVAREDDFQALIKKEYFPYFVQSKNIENIKIELYAIQDNQYLPPTSIGGDIPGNFATALNDNLEYTISLEEDNVLERNKYAQIFLIIRYTIE